MPLLAVTSRLAHTASLISQTCGLNTKPPGPFTHALLGNVPIIEIIRDADESERKLVRLEGEEVGRKEVGVNGVGKAKVKKAVEADGAVNGLHAGEDSVEVLAGAALELVEEYESMPRAKQHILKLLERSAEIHESIAALRAELESERQPFDDKGLQTSQATLQDMESSVRDLEGSIASARQKRDTLRARLRELKHSGASPSRAPGTASADEGENPFLSNTALARSIGLPSAISAAAAETSVSSTSTAEGILRDDSPLITRSANVRRGILGLEEEEDGPFDDTEVGEDSFDLEEAHEAESLLDEMGEPEIDMDDEADEDLDEDEADEPTVILQSAPLPTTAGKPEPVAENPPSKQVEERQVTPAMEIALNKIWSTSAGQCLDPGVQEGSSLSPNDTLNLLSQLLSPPSPPHSPLHPSSVSSLMPNPNYPTPDTVLLAKLLSSLFSSPSLTVPLNSLKDQLKKFAAERGFDDPGEKALRGVYGAVGRGIVRIDRAKGVVVFA
ncbi:hypothetical protein CALCODRAFT_485364 [Calocera cornea HHB12733]|uniref:Uncharacterized protein n=1 Tax=Calocera cornea HHB12733 TaxID=1353952 RepID=A0A165EDA9_9BASI|nr:hypothetical protein CALCODRAFT_485364 [Calocera cornea HHB12733]